MKIWNPTGKGLTLHPVPTPMITVHLILRYLAIDNTAVKTEQVVIAHNKHWQSSITV